MAGSPPLSLASIDWKSIGWTLLTAAIAATLTALVDSVLPDLKERGVIDGALFTMLTTLLHGLRKFLTDTRILRVLLVGLLLLPAGHLQADEVAVMIDGNKPGSYLLTVAVDGSVTVNPIRVVRPGQTPTPPDKPDQPPPTPFELEVERVTNTALAAGASKVTAAALSSVYSLVSVEVAEGRITPANALPAVSAATNAVLAAQADRATWSPWRTSVSGALTTLAQQGALSTKEQYASALKQIATGINSATGVTVDPSDALKQPTSERAIRAIQASLERRGQLGILDGIDLAKLIELIKLVMELLKLFGA
jgi:hypothetical protein